jgi:long-chain-fatty-acid--[acyl-carrier-protein] ligase
MRTAAVYLLWAAARVILWFRYSLSVAGRADAARHPGPFLVLPNHPAYADPPNVVAALWPTFRFRPMLLETNFQNPVLAPIAWLLRAIKVPETAVASAEVRERAQGAVAAAIDALKAGDNVILWPSGTLSRTGSEKLGGARAVADVLAAVPHATVVLVRTRGLWGSSLSWAYGTKPKMVPTMLRGIPVVLSNLLFFTPRRRVSLTVEAFPAGTRPEPTREAINPWLEAWYNADTPREEPTYVPYHFALGPRTVEYPPPWQAAGVDADSIPAAARQGVVELLEDKLKRPLADAEKEPATSLADLGLDSLDGMEVALEVERRFGFSGGEVPATVGQLWALAAGKLDAGPPPPPPEAWFAPPTGDLTADVLGETVPAALVARCLKTPNDVAAADELSGVLTYRRFFLGALILAERFRNIPGESVGLLLPASAAGTLSLFALHLAGKRPVVLNWTTGPGNMQHAVKLTGVSHVVTSKRFIDRSQVEVPGAGFVFLEDVRATVGTVEKLRRLVGVSLFPAATARRALARLDPDPQKPAVVLFTSGSEKAPKAVPLTHANVVGDIRASLPMFELDRRASVLVFLPLFHSFGHTITGLLPLVAGVRAVYHPDPTDAGALARKAGGYRVAVLCGTPTFLGFLLDRAKGGDFDRLEFLVVGAEKCPPRVFEQVKRLAPRAVVLEGYGVTECSPCVSVNPRWAPRPGTIGQPLAGVKVRVVDVDTERPVPPGGRGLLHVAGVMVFPGYLGHDGPQPFAEADGERWYNTGDLVSQDADGYLTFHGRLKRFLKAGGEMISLPALEEPFAAKYPPGDAGPRVAVEGVETDAGRRVVLFTTEDISLKDANALLASEGFRGVMRLDEVRRVDRIPVLGTGKTDYKVLRAELTT